MSYLTDEYKILQDKIDKIGAFRVTIKGWSVTATVAGIVAVTSGKGISPKLDAAAIDVLLAFFFWFEREQVLLAWMFGGRARSIEIQIDKRRRSTRKTEQRLLYSSPNIARALFGTKKPMTLIRYEFSNKVLEKCRLRTNKEVKLALKSDLVFYLVLAAASWLPTLLVTKAQDQTHPVVVQNIIQQPTQIAPSAAPTTMLQPPHLKPIKKSGKSK